MNLLFLKLKSFSSREQNRSIGEDFFAASGSLNVLRAVLVESCPGTSTVPGSSFRRTVGRFVDLVRLRAPVNRSPDQLCDNLVHDISRNIGQAEIAAAVAVGEPRMVQSQQMENRGMEIVEGDRSFHRFMT